VAVRSRTPESRPASDMTSRLVMRAFEEVFSACEVAAGIRSYLITSQMAADRLQ
jgi:hypothetical protein